MIGGKALLALVALFALLATGCESSEDPDADAVDAADLESLAQVTPAPTAPPRLESELVLEAEFPAVMAFAPDGRLFYNELKSGNVRVIGLDGKLLAEPFATVEVAEGDEWGLIGLTFDPDYETNHFVYIFYTAPAGELARPTILRYREENNVGVEPVTIAEFPTTLPDHAAFHIGGNIHFGPDGYLYVSLGNYAEPNLSQDLTLPMGAYLRLDRDGNPAPGNPVWDFDDADPRIYATGIRNSFDFAFHPETGALYATENGHTNCDELNVVEAGENYGWPWSYDELAEVCKNAGETEAIYYFPLRPEIPAQASTVAPTGIEFMSGAAYPAIGDSLLVCEYNTGRMIAYTLSGRTNNVVTPTGPIVNDCQLDIAVGPDGSIYYSNLQEIRRVLPQ